jgi:hypothetical protein
MAMPTKEIAIAPIELGYAPLAVGAFAEPGQMK